MEQGKRGLRTKAEPEERELILARAKIGELMMRLELAEDLIEKSYHESGVMLLRVVGDGRPIAKEEAMYSIGVDFHKAYSHITVLGRVNK